MKRAAVIGTGELGIIQAEKLRASKRAELVAVVDPDAERCKRLARRFNCEALSDYKDLATLNIHCACVSVPTAARHETAKWLLQNEVDVLIDRPMATTAGQARDLIAIAKSCGRVLQVEHAERFNPSFRAIEKILHGPKFLEVKRVAPFDGRGTDVDVVMDLMIHDIEIISLLVDRPLRRVDAIGVPVLSGCVDIANARLTFEGGAVASLSASRAAVRSERTIRIFQPELYVSLNYDKKVFSIYTKGRNKGPNGQPEIHVEQLKLEDRDAYTAELESFLEAVYQRRKPVVTGEDGLRALELAEKIRFAFHDSFTGVDEDSGFARRYGNFLG